MFWKWALLLTKRNSFSITGILCLFTHNFTWEKHLMNAQSCWAEMSRPHQTHTCPNHKYMIALVRVCVRNVCCYNFPAIFHNPSSATSTSTLQVFCEVKYTIHSTVYVFFIIYLYIFSHLECIRLCWFYYFFIEVYWLTILYWLQVDNTVICYFYTLWNDPCDKSSYHLSP